MISPVVEMTGAVTLIEKLSSFRRSEKLCAVAWISPNVEKKFPDLCLSSFRRSERFCAATTTEKSPDFNTD